MFVDYGGASWPGVKELDWCGEYATVEDDRS